MPNLTLSWDDPGESIVRLDVHADYTWVEFSAAVAQVSALAADKPHRCDILINLGKYSAESSGIPAIQKALGALDHLPRNVGLVIIVVGGLAGLIFNAAKRLDSRVASRARTAPSVEKARELVAQERQTT